MTSENTQLEFCPNDFPLLLNGNYRAKKLGERISSIQEQLLEEYLRLQKSAPKRVNYYWADSHNGIITENTYSKEKPKRELFEEYLEMALWSQRDNLTWSSPKAGKFRLLDYQFPLYAYQKKNGIGEVDLIGATNCGQLTVIELKVSTNFNPFGALIQGVRYTAIILNKDNWKFIRKEARKKGIEEIQDRNPIIQLLAPEPWWDHWLNPTSRRASLMGDWKKDFDILINNFEKKSGTLIECLALPPLTFNDIKWDSSKKQPNLYEVPLLKPVTFVEE